MFRQMSTAAFQYSKPSLAPKNAEVIAATLPLVGSKVDEIAKNFYGRMLGSHPELRNDLFNRGNQKGSQQRALAGSVAVYATLLLDGSAEAEAKVTTLLERIAHKHVSLGVVRPQYDVVYENLFAAIVDVLGADVVSPEIAEAWKEVYWNFADDLLKIEDALYAASGVKPGDVWRTVSVVSAKPNGKDTTTIELAPVDPNFKLPTFVPGQYVSVSVELADGAHQKRQYSLVSEPGEPTYKITVRKDGEVSTFLDERKVGDRVELSLPFGEFVLPSKEDAGLRVVSDRASTGATCPFASVFSSATPTYLVALGVGVTPLVPILRRLSAAGRPVRVLLGDSDPARASHREDVRAAVAADSSAQLDEYYVGDASKAAADLETGFSGEALERLRVHEGLLDLPSVPKDAHVFIVGAPEFLTDTVEALKAQGHLRDNIHAEIFGPTDARQL